MQSALSSIFRVRSTSYHKLTSTSRHACHRHHYSGTKPRTTSSATTRITSTTTPLASVTTTTAAGLLNRSKSNIPLAFMTNLYTQYIHRLKTHPIFTKSLTAFIIGGAADAVAQAGGEGSHSSASTMVKKETENETEGGKLSIRRILSFATSSATITAPMYHFAYMWLERTTKSVPKMVFIDSLCVTPVWYILYIPLVTLLSKGSLQNNHNNNHNNNNNNNNNNNKTNTSLVQSALISNAKPVATLTVTVLPPIEVFNFVCVPLHLRVPFMCCVDFVFTAAVSFIANRKKHQNPPTAISTTSKEPELELEPEQK